ncbi:MAG: hypothetical protein H0U27_05040 [Nitrosopumilus sp.]|nr:hypothetical protein [Nitrosopumilus sp.]
MDECTHLNVPLEIYLYIALFSDIETISNMFFIIPESENYYQYIITRKYPATLIYYNSCKSWKVLFRNVLTSQQKLNEIGFPLFNLPSFDPIKISQDPSDFNLWKYGILHSIEINDIPLMVYCANQMDYLLEPWVLLQWSVRANNLLITQHLLNKNIFTVSDLRYVTLDAQGKIKEILTELLNVEHMEHME